MAFADSSIVVLALPQLLGDFGATITSVSWVTSYNVAVAVLALALIPFVRRLRADRLRRGGASSSSARPASRARSRGPGRSWSPPERSRAPARPCCTAGSVPLLGSAAGSQARAVVWGAAGVMGAAVGPALGGALTQAFDWRAIFIAQVPLAAAAIAATIRGRRPCERSRRPGVTPPARRWISGAALALISAALVGALFLAVVLMIDGWGTSRCSPRPSSAPCPPAPGGRPDREPQRPLVAVGAGILLVSGSLLAMALLPEPSLAMLGTALALCGLGWA